MGNTITFSFGQILGVFAGAGTIVGTISAVRAYRKSIGLNYKERIADNERLIKEATKRLDDVDTLQRVMCRSVLALVNHEITGNNIEKLKQARDEIQNTLIGG